MKSLFQKQVFIYRSLDDVSIRRRSFRKKQLTRVELTVPNTRRDENIELEIDWILAAIYHFDVAYTMRKAGNVSFDDQYRFTSRRF